MKSSELRIGNLVYGLNNENHSKKQVDTIANIYQYGWETVGGKSGIAPIPLTEEWLIKFGFEQKGELKDFYLGKYWIASDDNFSMHTDFNGIYDLLISNSIKYVHTLQNLYFALTEEELTIKS